MISLKSNFELLARYNQWMNSSIYQSASQLGKAELDKDRGAFFGSMMGTLNHLLAGDTVWLQRFSAHEQPFQSLAHIHDLRTPTALDSILYAEFDSLWAARIHVDDLIIGFVDELTDNVLDSSLCFNNATGEPCKKNLGTLLQHLFNHQTHHRGQVTTLLTQAGVRVGVTDLVAMIPNELDS